MSGSEMDDETLGQHSGPAQHDHSDLHPRIGRYRIERLLGKGGFGLVYLARDEQLDRPVAVKVPHAELVSRPEDAELYLAEARMVASLEHPNIVPVHDVGSTAAFPCFVVSRFVAGSDLATHLKQTRLSHSDAARLVATVAEALHYAHKSGIVHRDVKPGNILIDPDGKPFIVDFGLALREENVDKGLTHAGTPAYMSPEQARGEGHRVDGRSDIFSLGVLFYEMLAGRRPFRADTRSAMFDQILTLEPRPLSQYDERIPKELQRICVKALSKRASERFSSAHEMAEDLRHFLNSPESLSTFASARQTMSSTETAAPAIPSQFDSPESTRPGSESGHPDSESQIIRIVPKGLRSFDSHDADFFLELLPGVRDRTGLPESIRFWKTHIEGADPEETFSIGLIYGPSGCGKSSLVKAGLLPRLSPDVVAVYFEATPDETELQLLSGLRKRCPLLDERLSLTESLAALRRGQALPAGKKILIVIDQFEQWLHAKRDQENTELVTALRQCDGGHVQCVVMVRDDFWMAATRFMRDLEVRLVEGQNSAAVDLFPIRHAKKVLSAFGRAFDSLPGETKALTKEQSAFLSQAVAGLAEEGKVVCVRLALFAEMFKGRPWTPAALHEVGGTTGVGVTFLEETFAAKTAPPVHRYHQAAARAVLKSLLPDEGTDIKGAMRAEAELRAASCYENRPRDFADLMRMLDSELRLITPANLEGVEAEEGSRGKKVPNSSTSDFKLHNSHFQLTHDYLVPSLREWLTRKQRETRRGRAELKLAERAASWNSKPENRFLPSLWEYLQIRTQTTRRQWTDTQRAVMSQATRLHALRSTLAAVAMIGLLAVGLSIRSNVARQQEATRIEGLVGRLISAEPGEIPTIVAELESNPQLAAKAISGRLQQEARTPEEKRSQLHARLASVGRDPSLVEPLQEELLRGKVNYVAPIREQLRPYASQQRKKLETLLRDTSADTDHRFRAALALADYVPGSETEFWTDQDIQLVSSQLVSSNAEFQPLLRDILRPIKLRLLDDLGIIFRDDAATAAKRVGAANALADYARDDNPRLLALLPVANAEQYRILFPLVDGLADSSALQPLRKIVGQQPEDDWDETQRVTLGRQRAGAAITLLKLGDRKAPLEALKTNVDMESISQFAARCPDRAVSTADLVALWDKVDRIRQAATTATVQERKVADRMLYGLLVTLGSYQFDSLTAEQRAGRIEQLLDWYATCPSSGIHGATGWLLRQWGQDEMVSQIDNTPVPYDPDREWFVMRFEPTVDRGGDELENPEPFCLTFVVFPAGQYRIGSPESENDPSNNETQVLVTLTRPVAISDREICWHQYSPHDLDLTRKGMSRQVNRNLTMEEPSFGMNWFQAVGYCRWLGQAWGLAESDQCYPNPGEVEKNADGNPHNWPLRLDRKGFRLPTDAEWEIACRGGMTTAFSFGSDLELLRHYGWYKDNSEDRSHPAGQLLPDSRGLYDMHGNLWEWTHDWLASDRENEAVDPVGPELGTLRVNRGGWWKLGAEYCRSAIRTKNEPSIRNILGGFRLALSPSSESTAPGRAEGQQGEAEADR